MTSVLTRLIQWFRRISLARALRSTALDMAVTREHLSMAEADLEVGLPPEIHWDIQRDVVELRARLAALVARADYIRSCQASLP